MDAAERQEVAMAESNRRKGRDLDRDPNTGQPEDHVGGMAGGAFAGAAAGGVAGAAIAGAATGTIAGGPLGAAVGAAVGVVAGSVVGGIAGKAIAERINPEHEHDYWINEFPTRTYAVSSPYDWNDFWPAYRLGYERYPEYHPRPFEEVEAELAREWERSREASRLSWDEARPATRDAYERIARSVERGVPGDSA
jgi:hypothetical protein